jgi:hypothetical protein
MKACQVPQYLKSPYIISTGNKAEVCKTLDDFFNLEVSKGHLTATALFNFHDLSTCYENGKLIPLVKPSPPSVSSKYFWIFIAIGVVVW